jgi:nucleoside-diphosphate-sugar epimerase
VRVYDRPSEGVLDESTAAAPKGEDPSSDDKLEGEQIVLARGAQYGVPVVVIQPAIVYGPNAHYTLEMVNDLRTGRVILVNGGVGICNLVYVDDAVSALLLAATNDRAHGERFLISGPEHPTWAEFVGAFEATLGVHRTVSLSERDALCLWQRSSGLRERLLEAGEALVSALRAPVSAEDRPDDELPIKALSPWVVKNRARQWAQSVGLIRRGLLYQWPASRHRAIS